MLSPDSLPDVEKRSDSSVMAPDPVDEEKEQDISDGNTVEDPEPTSNTPKISDEYPTGKGLVPIIVSLVCVVFLVSLDMVSADHKDDNNNTNNYLDHCRHCDT